MTGTIRRALSVAVRATISYRGADAGGTGRNAMYVPFGATGTEAPLIVSVAWPLPVCPNTKFESRTVIVLFGDGKVETIASGPSINGMAGNGGALRGAMPRSKLAMVGGDGGGVRAGAGWEAVDDAGGDEQPARNAAQATARAIHDFVMG